MHVIVGKVRVLLELDAERLQGPERLVRVVVERLEQVIFPLRQAQRAIVRIEQERSGHTRKIGKRVLLTIDDTCLLHEPIVRHPHPGDRLTSGPTHLLRLLQHDHAGAQFVGVQRGGKSGNRSANNYQVGG